MLNQNKKTQPYNKPWKMDRFMKYENGDVILPANTCICGGKDFILRVESSTSDDMGREIIIKGIVKCKTCNEEIAVYVDGEYYPV